MDKKLNIIIILLVISVVFSGLVALVTLRQVGLQGLSSEAWGGGDVGGDVGGGKTSGRPANAQGCPSGTTDYGLGNTVTIRGHVYLVCYDNTFPYAVLVW